MIQAVCIQKNRDDKGNIISYVLMDANAQLKTVSGKEIKQAIRKNKLCVINLQIDKAGRLIDREESYSSSTIDTMSYEEKEFMNNIIQAIASEIDGQLYEYGCIRPNSFNRLLFFCLDHIGTDNKEILKEQSRIYKYFVNNNITLETEREILKYICKGIVTNRPQLYKMCLHQILNGWLH